MKKIRRILGRNANKILKTINLEVAPIGFDFAARLESSIHKERMFLSAVSSLETWLASQTIWPARKKFDLRAEVELFYEDYLATPFRNPRGGSRFGNLLWLNILAKTAQPDIIVDSGTFTGASAWALSRGAPQAKVTSCDIDLSRLIYRSPNVNYQEADWTTIPADDFKQGLSFVYFDDHLDQGRRLREAHQRKISLTAFDDDYSVLNFAGMAHGGQALPKISFIIDPQLKDGEVIEWSENGRLFSWRVDRKELDQLAAMIEANTRLPNLASEIGFEQLPYRIVKLAA